MSSTFSSTRAKYGSTGSHDNRPQSRSTTVSERSTSASKHSKTSKHSSRGSSRKTTSSASNTSDASFSKSNSRMSSAHSTRPSYQQEHRLTLAEIHNNVQANGDLQERTLPMNESPFAYPARSNLHTVSSTTSTIVAERTGRIQALLDDLEPSLNVNGGSADTTSVYVYGSELELDGSDSEE